jgi:glycosyltransferase involved in cell wall biosynthesis
MLKDKGIAEFVTACRQLRAAGSTAIFRLAGSLDPGNPRAFTEAELRALTSDGVVEWIGRSCDMPSLLASAAIVCLPTTYGEGIPKILIEAASCGRPIVATDWPGCREIVVHGVTGQLVPPRDTPALSDALLSLLLDPPRRTVMGLAGRRHVDRGFSLGIVFGETLELYQRARTTVA